VFPFPTTSAHGAKPYRAILLLLTQASGDLSSLFRAVIYLSHPLETMGTWQRSPRNLWVPITSSVVVTWTNVLRMLESSTGDLAADTQHPTVGNTGSAAVVPWWDSVRD
jgi:hypothetical protein